MKLLLGRDVAHGAEEQLALGAAPLGQRPAAAELAERDLERKVRAVLAPPRDLADGAEVAAFPALEAAGDSLAVFGVERRRKQPRHVLVARFLGGETENVLGGAVERLDVALRIEGDDAVEHGVDNGAGGFLAGAPRRLVALDLGDVGLDRDNAAIAGRVLADLQAAAVGEIELDRAARVAVLGDTAANPRLGVAAEVGDAPAFDEGAHHVLEGRARGDGRAGFGEEFAVEVVAQHQAVVRVEQRHALVHALDGFGQGVAIGRRNLAVSRDRTVARRLRGAAHEIGHRRRQEHDHEADQHPWFDCAASQNQPQPDERESARERDAQHVATRESARKCLGHAASQLGARPASRARPSAAPGCRFL